MEENKTIEVTEIKEKKGLSKNAKKGLIGAGLMALGFGAYKLIKSCLSGSNEAVEDENTFEGIEEPIDDLEEIDE